MARIQLQGVSKTYQGTVRAVENLTMDVPAGKLVVLVGPSGCGKSTILRMIAGLVPPDEGTISIGLKVVNSVPAHLRKLAMMFQREAFLPNRDIEHNLLLTLKLQKIPRSQWQASLTQAAETLGISHLLHRMPHELSGGEAQRVALGRALLCKPDCFLLDEPLSHLDADLRREMRKEIKQLQQSLGVTMLFVTHDQQEALSLADWLIVLNQGKVQQSGTPWEVYQRPTNCFVAKFLGNPGMNILKGELRHREGDVLFTIEGSDQALYLGTSDEVPFSGNSEQGAMLGIRPENVREVETSESNAPNTLKIVVDQIELLGDCTLTHGHLTGGQRMTVKLSSAWQGSGNVCQKRLLPFQSNVVLSREHLHLFDVSGEHIKALGQLG